MNKCILTFILLGFLTVVNANPPKSTVYKVDTKNSTLKWTGKKTGADHQGTVMLKSGSIVMQNNVIKSGSFEIDMNSMKSTDLTGEDAGKLIGHLSSADFFDVKNYPTAKFVITKATKLSTGGYQIDGDLTVKGITKPVRFNSTLTGDSKTKTAKGKVVIDRTKYDIKFASKNFFENLGDKFVYDEFDVDLNLIFVNSGVKTTKKVVKTKNPILSTKK